MGTPTNVRVGPGTLYIAALGSTEPTDLATAWDADFVELGYTTEGSTFTFENTFEPVPVEEELDPIANLQTARDIRVAFSAAELTARNLQIALNGGTITAGTGIVTFEPPAAGDYTEVMIGWEADDGLERWVFRKCVQVGSTEITRRKAPNIAALPMEFSVLKPTGDAPFAAIIDTDYVAA